MMKNLLFLLLIASVPVWGQKKLKTLEVSDSILNASVDRAGDLYVITKSAQFQKFDKDGKLLVLFKNEHAPTLFDPRDGARIFAYYRELQEYDYLGPSFQVNFSFRIDPAFVIQPWLMCTAGDTKLWVLDAADNSLKKLNPKDNEVEIEVVIDKEVIHDAKSFTKMREYQNFVFLLHPKKGIYIFNTLGQFVKTIEGHHIPDFHFFGEELYYAHGHQINFYDLLTGETRHITLHHLKGDFILNENRLYAVHKKSLDIYEFDINTYQHK